MQRDMPSVCRVVAVAFRLRLDGILDRVSE